MRQSAAQSGNCALERIHSEQESIDIALALPVAAKPWHVVEPRHRRHFSDNEIPSKSQDSRRAKSLLEHIDGVLLSSVETRLTTPAAPTPIVAVVVALVTVVLGGTAAVMVVPSLCCHRVWVVPKMWRRRR